MQIAEYSSDDRCSWNRFIGSSKNGTFLFNRDYLEYHGNKYADFSLIMRDDDTGAIFAVLPAHREDCVLLSHAGLTYGGLVTDESMKLPKMLEVFDALFRYLHAACFTTLRYKTVPRIYHRMPAEEDLYGLYLANAQLVRRHVMSVLPREMRPPFQQRRTRGARRAKQTGIIIQQMDDWTSYWRLLTERLCKTHGARPVHTLEEIQLLASRFPANIKLFGALLHDELVAGVVVHETDQVARAQYIAANDIGQRHGALDLLFSDLLSGQYAAKAFFDFGTSEMRDGAGVNRGLIDQKEGYGARAIVHDHYEVDVARCAARLFSDALR